MNLLDWMQYIRGKRCAVVGIGVSNRPLIDFLLMRGAIVCARDRKTREQLGETAEELEKLKSPEYQKALALAVLKGITSVY